MLKSQRFAYQVVALVYCVLGAILFLLYSIASTGDEASMFQVCMALMLGMAAWSGWILANDTSGDAMGTTQAAVMGFTPKVKLYYQIMIALSAGGIVGGFLLNRLVAGHLAFLANILFVVSIALCAGSVLLLRALTAKLETVTLRPQRS